MCEINQNASNIELTWHLVSQFVSWEYCRNICDGSELDSQPCQTDLFRFFREMVIEKTTKTKEYGITKHEIVAKFLEEIKTVQSLRGLDVVEELSKPLNEICPELRSATSSLLASFKNLVTLLETNKPQSNNIQKKINMLLREFSVLAYKILPVPDLPKACTKWIWESKSENSTTPVREQVLKRLEKESLSHVEAQEVLQIINNDEKFMKFMQESDNESESDVESEVPTLPAWSDHSSDVDQGNVVNDIQANPLTVPEKPNGVADSNQGEQVHIPIELEDELPKSIKRRTPLMRIKVESELSDDHQSMNCGSTSLWPKKSVTNMPMDEQCAMISNMDSKDDKMTSNEFNDIKDCVVVIEKLPYKCTNFALKDESVATSEVEEEQQWSPLSNRRHPRKAKRVRFRDSESDYSFDIEDEQNNTLVMTRSRLRKRDKR